MGFGATLGLILAFFAGLALVEMGFTEPDLEMASRIFSIICGIIMVLPGLMLFPSMIGEWRKKRTEVQSQVGGKTGVIAGWLSALKFLVFMKKEPVLEDRGETEELLHSFRDSFDAFFHDKDIRENTLLQSTSTQVYWNILGLQKKRLDRKGLTMEFSSQRMAYGEYPKVTEKTFFDGKYQITEVSESVTAKKIFKTEEKVLGQEQCTRIARYRLLNAKKTNGDKIICPNCANQATRENLLDGCDFCGTKFTVEDLGLRVSDFDFRNDYDLEYDIYRDARSRFSLWVGLLVGIPIGILSLIGAIGAILGGAAEGSGIFMIIVSILLTVAFLVFAMVTLSLCFFYFFVFPAIQAIASAIHLSKYRLATLKESKRTDEVIEKKIKETDPLFSLVGFYSSV